MKRILAAALASAVLAIAAPAFAEDAVGPHAISAVTERADYASQLQGVSFYFGDQGHPAVSRVIERDATTSLRTRKFGRSNEEACQWVMLSALIQLRDHALAVGGNAVVNVRSNWRNNTTSSTTEYQCSAGFLMAGVALKGDVVRLR
ncbi:MAG TPA: hypothetical protein VG841_06105 [Caulobacterales bacterium]|nr:hypothetical protein [Caulobacterales bacterium]